MKNFIFVLFILLFYYVGTTQVLAATIPLLPQVYLNTTYQGSISGTCNVTLMSGSSVQNAIDTATQTSNYVICLQAGGTFDSFVLRNKIGNGWITIRTTTPDGQFIAPGTRVKPSDSSLMAKVRSLNSQDVIYTESGAHNYRLIGLEVTSTFATRDTTLYALIRLGDHENEPTLSQTPTDITIDRCYIHGTPTGNYRRGVNTNGRRLAVIDSYISDIHEVGADSQGIGGWNGAGPFKIVNNYIEASGENIMFGGSNVIIPGLIPSDIEVRNNYFFKPLSWKIGDPSYAGIPWSVKNLFELKNAQRVLVDSNIFENNWIMAQAGTAILFNGVDGPTSVIRHVTFINNIVKNSESAFALCVNCSQPQMEATSNVLIKNNLFDNINARGLQLQNGPTEVTFENNTLIEGWLFLNVEDVFPTNLIFRNNIVKHNQYGISGSIISDYGPTNFFTSITFQKNVIMDPTEFFPSFYPAQNYVVPSSDVGFLNYSGRNYQLSNTSIYKNAGTDGKDIGADIPALLVATANVLSGISSTPPPDTTSPTISSILSSVTTTTASITWTTNESSDTQVEYGLSTAYGSVTSLKTSLTTSHIVSLSGLTPSTSYNYRVKSRDLAGNLAVGGNQTFTTSAQAPTGGVSLNTTNANFGSILVSSTTPPLMFSLTNTTAGFIGVSNVQVTGDYAITTNFCNQGTQPNTHCDVYVTFRPTASGTRTGTLTFNLTGASVSSLQATLSGIGSAVPIPPDTTAPLISLISAGSITQTGAVISWTTNEMSDTQIEYGLNTSYGSNTSLNTNLSLSRSVTVSNLQPGTTYNYRVKSRDLAGNLAVGGNQTFTTSPSSIIPGTVSANVSSIDFGSVNLNSSTLPSVISLKNGTATSVVIQNIEISGDFGSTNNTCVGTIQRDASCSISIIFTPRTARTRTSTLRVNFTTSGIPSIQIPLVGIGIDTTVLPTPVPVVLQPVLVPPPTCPPTPIQARSLTGEISTFTGLCNVPSGWTVITGTPFTTVLLTKSLVRGMTDKEVLVLQNYLKTTGFLSQSITTISYYGPATEQAVKKYQASHGIEQTGTVGPLTRSRMSGGTAPTLIPVPTIGTVFTAGITTTSTRALSFGMKGNDVSALQRTLKRLGYLPTNQPVTGYFGTATRTAVRDFQRAEGIVSSGTAETSGYGMVGKRTAVALARR